MQKDKNNLTIGELADLAGLNIQSIRYYERLELLPEPERSDSGYRLYNQDYLAHIVFIKNAQELGFKLEEIKDLVEIKFNAKAKGKDVKKIIHEKLEFVEEEITKLQKVKKYLQELDKSCSGKMSSSCCPILQKLSSQN